LCIGDLHISGSGERGHNALDALKIKLFFCGDAAPESASMLGISRTSVYVAAARAIGAREPDTGVRNPDSLAEKLLGDPAELNVDHPVVRALTLPYDDAMRDIEVGSTVRAMIVRTRFIDDAMARAVAGGAAQVVILGAGFDSHAYRCQKVLAGARVFEVDRATTQALKRERVNAVLGGPPANLTYVAIDFQQDDLGEVLERHGYNRSLRTFFILEGVTMYLPEAAVRSTFRFVAAHAPGSGIVFDYVYRAMIDAIARIDLATAPPAAKAFLERFLKLTANEPWVFGLPMDGERKFLSECGLELRETLMIGGEESVRRYLTRADGTQVGAQAIAEAMARQAQAAKQAGAQTPTMSPERMREQARMMAYQLADAVVA
jgi:methyltransferase (TIGR00027 family)